MLELEGACQVLQGHLARLAQGKAVARAGARPRDRAAGGRDRRAGAVRHPVPRGHARRRRSRARSSSRSSSGSERDPRDGKALGFAFKPRERTGRVVFEVEDGELRIGDRVLMRDAELWLERGEHVTLVGPTEPEDDADPRAAGRARARRGQAAPRPQPQARAAHPARGGAGRDRHRAGGVPAGDGVEAERDARAAGALPVQRRGGREAARRALGRRAPAALAGGARQSGANVLILDEPTNHLDLESREALESALQQFPGALLLISHDRALLDAVGTRTIAVADQTLHSYVGGWPEYVRVREERAEPEREAKARAKVEAEREGPRPPAHGGAQAALEEPAAPARGLEAEIERPRPRWRRSRGSSRTRRRGTTRAARRRRPGGTRRRSGGSTRCTPSSRL